MSKFVDWRPCSGPDHPKGDRTASCAVFDNGSTYCYACGRETGSLENHSGLNSKWSEISRGESVVLSLKQWCSRFGLCLRRFGSGT